MQSSGPCLWSSIMLLFPPQLHGLAGSWMHVKLICPQASSQWVKVKDKVAMNSSDEIPSLTGGTATLCDVSGQFKVPLANRSIQSCTSYLISSPRFGTRVLDTARPRF